MPVSNYTSNSKETNLISSSFDKLENYKAVCIVFVVMNSIIVKKLFFRHNLKRPTKFILCF